MAESTRTPNPPGAEYFVIWPGQGVNLSGSSALMRHSKLWPFSLMSGCLNESGNPDAMRICSLIKSMPVTISVIGCST